MTLFELHIRLGQKDWFKNSASDIRDTLMQLPISPFDQIVDEKARRKFQARDCRGFLEDLLDHPDEGGGVRLVRIVDLMIPNFDLEDGRIFGILVNFEVEKLGTSERYRYQYLSWRQGPESGTKGVVLLRDEVANEIVAVITLWGYSFAAGTETFDCFGGFTGGLTATKDVERELQEELALDLGKADETIFLGRYRPDRGMTNNRPNLVAVIFDTSHLTSVEKFVDNPDPYEMRSGPRVISANRLWGRDGFMFNNEDGYFQACMNRLIALGVISPPA